MNDFAVAYTFVREAISAGAVIGYALALASIAGSIALAVHLRRPLSSSSAAEAPGRVEHLVIRGWTPGLPVFVLIIISTVDSRLHALCALLVMFANLLLLWRLWHADLVGVLFRPKDPVTYGRSTPDGFLVIWTLGVACFGLFFSSIRYGRVDGPYADLLQLYQRQEYQVVEGCISLTFRPPTSRCARSGCWSFASSTAASTRSGRRSATWI